ncbi:hypothetical protein B0H13DRAFT_1853657 [Mycena leptocephala]|nr:hypothetical protein B0H13DRAFT_1853657 [Mycena leptocephala]
MAFLISRLVAEVLLAAAAVVPVVQDNSDETALGVFQPSHKCHNLFEVYDLAGRIHLSLFTSYRKFNPEELRYQDNQSITSAKRGSNRARSIPAFAQIHNFLRKFNPEKLRCQDNQWNGGSELGGKNVGKHVTANYFANSNKLIEWTLLNVSEQALQ